MSAGVNLAVRKSLDIRMGRRVDVKVHVNNGGTDSMIVGVCVGMKARVYVCVTEVLCTYGSNEGFKAGRYIVATYFTKEKHG